MAPPGGEKDCAERWHRVGTGGFLWPLRAGTGRFLWHSQLIVVVVRYFAVGEHESRFDCDNSLIKRGQVRSRQEKTGLDKRRQV